MTIGADRDRRPLKVASRIVGRAPRGIREHTVRGVHRTHALGRLGSRIQVWVVQPRQAAVCRVDGLKVGAWLDLKGGVGVIGHYAFARSRVLAFSRSRVLAFARSRVPALARSRLQSPR